MELDTLITQVEATRNIANSFLAVLYQIKASRQALLPTEQKVKDYRDSLN
jgi:hypothetical protein